MWPGNRIRTEAALQGLWVSHHSLELPMNTVELLPSFHFTGKETEGGRKC